MEKLAEPRGGVEAARASLAPLRATVEDALRATVAALASQAPTGVGEVLRYIVLAPGKRIRPVLLLSCYRAAGGEHPAAARLSCAVELVHAYSLVHDDLPCMDDDTLRRGRPTAHVRYGAGAAVLAGAVLLPAAVWTVVESGEEMGLPESRVRRLVATLTAAAGARGMVGGQFRDLRAERRRVSKAELEETHRGKTGALMGGAAAMGGMAAGGPESLVGRYRAFGETLGVAFQVVDDILDCTGLPSEMGKAGGRDRARRKASAPRVLGLEAARRLARRRAREAVAEVAGVPGAELLEALAETAVDRVR